MKIKAKKLTEILVAFVTVTVLTLYVSTLVGCSLFSLFGANDYVEFTRSSLVMYVGDSYDLSEIIESDTPNYNIRVSPSTVATVKGTRLTALNAGSADVIVSSSSYTDTLKLTVKAQVESALSISASGELVQTIDSVSEVVFTPTATGSTSNGIEWYVNDILTDTLSSSTVFRFTPDSVGEFVITARSGDFSASETVRVYYPVSVSCSYSGELLQEAPFTTVTFTATATNNPLNPSNSFEWFVDGIKRDDVSGNVFAYLPTAGSHTVTLKVNGKQTEIDGSMYVTVVCMGAIVPNQPTIEFDNLYPHVYIIHNAEGNVCLEITPPGGTATEYRQTDLLYGNLFEDGRVDVGELIDLCATGSTRGAYKFRIKSLGDGGALRESEYSDSLVFTQLAKDAAQYISQIYCDKDYYITSPEEYVNILEYKIVSRNKTANATVSFNVYIAYNTLGSATDLWNSAFPIAATSGTYTNIHVSKSGSVMSTSFRVNTVNTPSRQTRDTSSDSAYAGQLHAILPHINFDESKYRDVSHVFPIDTLERTQSVTYTDELYLAAQNHSKPLPTNGSSAEKVYEIARNILRQICTDDMTDAQKAHAIYDWIMWQVTYDTPATTYFGSSESLSAYYLEGVFGNGVTSIGGVTYKPYAVCDGMSKAYSLMCSIEGIPCVRVPGMAGNSLLEAGGHAWNKVYIDGAWYIVDCTWGDATGTLSIDGRPKDYELGIHDHLFITDSMVEGNHFESYQCGDTDIIYAPETALNPYPVYSEYVYNGVTINCEISESENASSRMEEIARSFANAYTPLSSIYVPGYGDGEYSVRYQGFEIYFPSGVSVGETTVSNKITNAVRTVLPSADVRVLIFSKLVIVLVDA